MPLYRRHLLAALPLAALARPAVLRAQFVSRPIRVGEINSAATQPQFTEPYRKGWELALAKLNDLGGVNGRQMEFVTRDDGGSAEGAAAAAAGLLHDEKVDLFAGGHSSAAALAISAFAQQNKTLYVAGAPMADALVWNKGNRYTYRVGPSSFVLAAMLVEAALVQPAKTYVTVGADDASGRSAVQQFRALLSARRQDVRFVGEQWALPGRVDGAALANALAQPAPDAIFCALQGPELEAFIRQAAPHGLFNKRLVVATHAGDPEILRALGDQTPIGWLVTGYPWSLSDEPYSKQFASDYTARYQQPPGMASVVGVALVNAIAAGLLKAGDTNAEKMADGFAGASFTTPFGICRFRPIDHQSTLGSYVGRLTQQNGHGGMVDWRYVDGAAVMPPDDVVRQQRPA